MKLLLPFFLFFSINLLIAQNDSAYITPYLPENMPFTIEKKNLNINLPDSLEGGELKGFMRLTLFIDNVGNIDSFNIIQIDLKSKSTKGNILYYKYYPTPTTSEVYPKNVLPYYLYLADWIKQVPVYKTQQTNNSNMQRLFVKCKIL